eukprot:914356-Amphidinium_carterae.1
MFSVVRQHAIRGDNTTDFYCPHVNQKTVAACAARKMRALPSAEEQQARARARSDCFPEQWRFHLDPMLADASIAFQWDPPGLR